MKLFKYSFKEVKITMKNGSVFSGILWRYYRNDDLCRDGDYIYYCGYDGGYMEEVKPSKVLKVELL